MNFLHRSAPLRSALLAGAPSEFGQDLFDEDGEHIASFIDRMEAAKFARSLPWWHGRCRIHNSGRQYDMSAYHTITLESLGFL